MQQKSQKFKAFKLCKIFFLMSSFLCCVKRQISFSFEISFVRCKRRHHKSFAWGSISKKKIRINKKVVFDACNIQLFSITGPFANAVSTHLQKKKRKLARNIFFLPVVLPASVVRLFEMLLIF